jgi:hypothetical protein
MVNFPTSLDAFTNPTDTNYLDTPGVLHTVQHSDANDAIEALEAKVGITGSADTNSLDYKVAHKQNELICVSKTANYTANPFELINCDISA